MLFRASAVVIQFYEWNKKKALKKINFIFRIERIKLLLMEIYYYNGL